MEGLQYGIQQGFNPMSAGIYGTQFGQQGLYGGGYANPLSGLMGSGIPGLFSQTFGRQQTPGQMPGQVPGQVIDGIGGAFQSYSAIDPLTAIAIQQAQLQQLQLAQLAQHAQQQGLLGPWSPYGMVPQQGQQFGFGGLSQLGRIDPITAACLQQAQIAQAYQQLALQSQLGQQAQLGHPFGHLSQLGQGQLGQGWQAGQFPLQNPWLQAPYGGGQFANQYGRTLPFQANPLQTGMMGVG